MTACAQCGTRMRGLVPSEHGLLCPQCVYRQAERDEPGWGLSAGTWGFDGEED